MSNTISTLPRFLYLNLYAILLFLGGICVLGIPFWKLSIWFIIPQAILIFIIFKASYRILSSWEDKKRKYAILIERNRTQLRQDTFYEYMQAPCGRLLVRIVLNDLGQSQYYNSLLKLRVPITETIKGNCKKQETKVYINPNFRNDGFKKS